MKIVIADDEYLVRTSLKSMLSELKFPIEIVGEAANGEELAALVKQHKPDIAFVDIKMPKLNGLEAIKISKEQSANTQWIILTGFSEFDYAKQSITLGASNYLLKPVSPEELQEALDVLFKRTKEYSSILNKEFENELIAWIHDLSTFPDHNDANVTSPSQYVCSLFIFDSYLNEKGKSDLQLKFYKAVRSVIHTLSTRDVRIALIPMPSGELATVGAWEIKNNEQAKSVIKTYFEEIASIDRQLGSDQLSITVLQSDECSSFEMLHKQIYQMQNLSSLRIITENSGRLTIGQLVAQYEVMPPELLELCTLLLRLAAAYKEKSYLNYSKALEDIKKIIPKSKWINSTDVKPVAKFLLHSINCRNIVENETKIWIQALYEHGESLLAESRKEENSSSDVVSQVIAFIDSNYIYDISIGQIAEQSNITPNYLSSLFHKRTGTTFMKYLTKVRMLKAKELLSNSGVQVQQVAEKVGYYSTRHFTKLFKEFHGYYPSDCRDKSKDNEY